MTRMLSSAVVALSLVAGIAAARSAAAQNLLVSNARIIVGDGQGLGQEAGYMPVNLRTLYDHGVAVTYSTDTVFNAGAALAHELKTLNLVFSPTDMIRIMGPNSARFLDREKDIGTLEPGKPSGRAS